MHNQDKPMPMNRLSKRYQLFASPDLSIEKPMKRATMTNGT
ncbi:hypothetical protein WER83_02300 [Staphylococcus felis]